MQILSIVTIKPGLAGCPLDFISDMIFTQTNTLTRTEERILDMVQAELQAKPFVVIGFHNLDCG